MILPHYKYTITTKEIFKLQNYRLSFIIMIYQIHNCAKIAYQYNAPVCYYCTCFFTSDALIVTKSSTILFIDALNYTYMMLHH